MSELFDAVDALVARTAAPDATAAAARPDTTGKRG